MSRGLNKVMIIGNLDVIPKCATRLWPPGTTFTVATSRSWNTADGERHTDTEWFNVVTWETGRDMQTVSHQGQQCISKAVSRPVIGKTRKASNTPRSKLSPWK